MVTTWLTLEYNRRRDTAGTDVVDLSAPEGVNLGIARGGISGQNRSEVATALADPTRQRDSSANFRVEANPGPADLTSISPYWTFRQTAQIGRAHVRPPVTNAHLVCRLLLAQKYS